MWHKNQPVTVCLTILETTPESVCPAEFACAGQESTWKFKHSEVHSEFVILVG